MLRFPLLLWLCALPLVLSAVGMPRIHRPSLDSGNHPGTPPEPATIIDFLSADPQYSYFLRHIQRLGLVPAVNAMANVTLFAPVNSAFVDTKLADHDSAQNVLRYFAAQRFRVSYLNATGVVLDSLYAKKRYHDDVRSYPLKIAPQTRSRGTYMVNDVAEIVEFDAYAKHQHSFIQTIDHLLPEAVSMCDLLMDSAPTQNTINGHEISFVKRVFQSVFALGDFRALHGQTVPSCDHFLANVSTLLVPTDRYIDASLSDMEKRYFLTLHHGLQNPELFPTKEATRELVTDALAFLSTLFLPDLVAGLNGTGHMGTHSSLWGKTSYNISYDTVSGRVRLNDKVWSVAGSTSLTLSDGLLHLFDSDPQDLTQADNFLGACNIERVTMVPRKTLYAMHFSQLARELKFYGKANLIGESVGNQTILVDASDRDDFFDEEELVGANAVTSDAKLDEFDEFDEDFEDFEDFDDFDDYEKTQEISTRSFSNRQQILYKFIDGFIDTSQLLSPQTPRFHKLYDSKLCSKKRIGSCFKVKVAGAYQNGKASLLLNDRFKAGPPFIAAGNNSIYVLENDFTVPPSFKNVMAQLISDGTTRELLDHVFLDKTSCLETLKYLDAFGLLSLKDNYHGYTVFLPCGRTIWEGGQQKHNKNYESWNSLGLVLKYLESHPDVFKQVLKGLFLEDLIYSDFGLEDNYESSRLVKTLNGERVNVSETYQEGDYNHIISVNSTSLSIPLNSDVLFNQGVIHITQDVLLPGKLHISLRDLVQADHGSAEGINSFTGFIDKFPKLSDALSLDDPLGSGYSLLVPTHESLQSFNITSDFSRLWDFLELHLISNSDAETLRRCMGIPFFEKGNSSYTIQTNRTAGTFKCHTTSSGKTYLTLPKKSNVLDGLTVLQEHSVRIINYGCSQSGVANSSCVFLLEKPLELSWFDPQDNFLHVHIGWISVGIGIVIGVILFGFCTTTVALCLSRAGQKKPPGPSVHPNFQPAGPSYMPITSDEDLVPGNYDYGYETDVDMLRNEADSLLPKKGGRRPPRKYGSSSPLGVPSAPRKIKKQAVIESINRERNLPSLNI